MMNDKTFRIIKAATNVISGMSMATLIILGVLYIGFNNAFVFNNAGIAVTNNPVTGDQINFILEGSRKHECTLTRVHSDAYDDTTGESYQFDFARKIYIRSNDYLGSDTGIVDHQWAMPVPEGMGPGVYRVSLYSEFDCVYLLFKRTKIQMFDNISLIVE
ncbi:hypothetical protein OAP94_01250 [bacterium]|nr:hypothetical protein [bacterium]MDC1007292.1 hypothetical protein [bacterium]